jgi:hypothetical protein
MRMDHIKKMLADLQKSGQLHINFADSFDIKTMSDADIYRIYQLIIGDSPIIQ